MRIVFLPVTFYKNINTANIQTIFYNFVKLKIISMLKVMKFLSSMSDCKQFLYHGIIAPYAKVALWIFTLVSKSTSAQHPVDSFEG